MIHDLDESRKRIGDEESTRVIRVRTSGDKMHEIRCTGDRGDTRIMGMRELMIGHRRRECERIKTR